MTNHISANMKYTLQLLDFEYSNILKYVPSSDSIEELWFPKEHLCEQFNNIAFLSVKNILII